MSNQISLSSFRRKSREGRGSGQGADYLPWLTVRDAGSRGSSFRLLSPNGRQMHLLNRIEFDCALLLSWSKAVIDVREQFPLLPVAETREIAAELGYQHPRYTKRSRGTLIEFEEPMTTDFLVDLQTIDRLPANLAIHVRPKSAFEDTNRKVDRLLEKAEIERRYWERRNVAFEIVTDADIPKAVVANVELIFGQRDLSGYGFENFDVPAILEHLFGEIAARPAVALNKVCQSIDELFGLKRGSALVLTWHGLATKRWATDMAVKIDPTRPLRLCPAGAAP